VEQKFHEKHEITGIHSENKLVAINIIVRGEHKNKAKLLPRKKRVKNRFFSLASHGLLNGA
jgi:hypothetical protein